MSQVNFPHQKELEAHMRKFPSHTKFTFRGSKKKQKIEGVMCDTCKKFITTLVVRSNVISRG